MPSVSDSEGASGTEADALLGALIKAAVDGIVGIDSRGIIASVNPAACTMFGYSSDQLVGNNVRMLMPEPYRSEHDGYVQNYLDTRKPKIIGIGREVVGQRRDGSVFPMHLSVGQARVGEHDHFIGILRDITREKEAERARLELITELEKKNAELERFTYTVSHDLKSPLITIKGFLGFLESDVQAGNVERALADAARISSAADKMKQLLDELLELSRIGRLVNPPEQINLRDLALEVKDLLSGPLDEARVHVEIQEQMPSVCGDRLRLREVLQNLVENAVKFMGPQPAPVVSIGAHQEGDRVTCVVSDNGIGIGPKYLERIFGLFEQLDQNLPGTGVGLALVKRIVDVHGGRVWAESEGLGRGSRFHFELPSS